MLSRLSREVGRRTEVKWSEGAYLALLFMLKENLFEPNIEKHNTRLFI